MTSSKPFGVCEHEPYQTHQHCILFYMRSAGARKQQDFLRLSCKSALQETLYYFYPGNTSGGRYADYLQVGSRAFLHHFALGLQVGSERLGQIPSLSVNIVTWRN